MHIPDNYLSPATCAVMTAVMLPIWSRAVRKVEAETSRARIPQLGIAAAFTFLVMMFNLPAPGGTTAHAVGGTLAAVLVGPWAACLAVSVAVLIQALLFGDGGILALGANCFNMAVVIPFAGYHLYRALSGRTGHRRSGLLGLGVAAYVAVNLAALCAAVEFGIQPVIARDPAGLPLYCPYPLAVALPGMMLPHLLVAGFVEAFFTTSVFAFLRRVSPGSLHEGRPLRSRAVYALLAGMVCLCPLGLLAAGVGWGEWNLADLRGVLVGGRPLAFVPSGMARGFSLKAAFQDYAVLGLPAWAGYLWCALAGAAVLVVAFKLLGLRKRAGI